MKEKWRSLDEGSRCLLRRSRVIGKVVEPTRRVFLRDTKAGRSYLLMRAVRWQKRRRAAQERGCFRVLILQKCEKAEEGRKERLLANNIVIY